MLTYLTAGESHGPQLTAIIDGFPSGLPINIEQLNHQLARRQMGYGRGGRMKIESDRAELVGGVRGGFTMGGPIALVIANKDWPNWSRIMDPVNPIAEDLNLKEERLAHETTHARPGHADLAGGVKWNQHDLRNVLERASARETAARVAIGAIARQLLEYFSVKFASHVVRIGDVALPADHDRSDLDKMIRVTEESEVRCIDGATEESMIAAIRAAKKSRDSLGGVAEVIVRGLPIGLGGFSQWSQRLDSRLAAAMMSIPSVKGVEIGLGFDSARLPGSAVHDEIFYDPYGDKAKKGFHRETNNAGGIEGGITNGEDIVIRVAAKPISTLNKPLKTVDVNSKQPAEAMVERTDNCVVPAIAVIGEAMAALILADAFLQKFGSDNLSETEHNYRFFLETPY